MSPVSFRQCLLGFLGATLSCALLATAYASCTATGGLGRFTLGLDPALTCTDAEALRRVTALDLNAISTAGDVIVSGRFAPSDVPSGQFRFVRAQPIRGLLVTAIAGDQAATRDRLVLGWDEPLAFVRAPFERAGWRLSCQRADGIDTCRGERDIAGPGGEARRATLTLSASPAATERVRSISSCVIESSPPN